MYQDETLTCRDCGKEFVFTASEQAFYAEKGFQNKPRRCPECRAAFRAQNGGARPQREMFTAICAVAGKETQVPFQPRGDKPGVLPRLLRQSSSAALLRADGLLGES